MKVSGFMIPADKVVTVDPKASVQEALDLLVQNSIGSIVVVEHREEEDGAGIKIMPVGIITKSDVVKAYQSHVPLDDPCDLIMNRGPLHTCTPEMGRGRATRVMEQERTHHLVVVDEKDSHFVGLFSSWDIVAECARDDRAWPWPRFAPTKPDETDNRVVVSRHGYPTIVHHPHDSLTYEDPLDVLQFQ